MQHLLAFIIAFNAKFRKMHTVYSDFFKENTNNNDRPHSVLRYQTPEYFESKYYRSIGVYKESESNTDGSNLEK